MSATFTPCDGIGAPGWEATEGRFLLAKDGRLQFVQAFRRRSAGPGHRGPTFLLTGDTPRDVERRVAAMAERVAGSGVPS